MYEETYERNIEDEQEFCDIMVEIFEAMKANNVQLVDNLKFLEFAANTPNPISQLAAPDDTVSPENLPDDVKNAFLSEAGASAFTTVKDLRKALVVLFNYRTDVRNLEIVAVFRIRGPTDLSQCSSVTQEAGEKIQDDVFTGIFEGLDLSNSVSYYNEIVLSFIKGEKSPLLPG